MGKYYCDKCSRRKDKSYKGCNDIYCSFERDDICKEKYYKDRIHMESKCAEVVIASKEIDRLTGCLDIDSSKSNLFILVVDTPIKTLGFCHVKTGCEGKIIVIDKLNKCHNTDKLIEDYSCNVVLDRNTSLPKIVMTDDCDELKVCKTPIAAVSEHMRDSIKHVLHYTAFSRKLISINYAILVDPDIIPCIIIQSKKITECKKGSVIIEYSSLNKPYIFEKDEST